MVKRKRRTKEQIEADNKKKAYFGEVEEIAIKQYITSTSAVEKNKLYETVIKPALKELVQGVMKMPMFKNIIGIPVDILMEDAYYHTLFQVERFDPNKIGKDGQLVKAYSYLGTCCKHYLIAEKTKADKKIAKYGGQIQVDSLQEVIPHKESDSLNELEELREKIIQNLEKVLEKDSKKLTQNDLEVGHGLKHMLKNWHNINFNDKNQFLRELNYITGLDPIVVSKSFKKLKPLVYGEKLVLNKKKKVIKRKVVKEEEVEEVVDLVEEPLFIEIEINEMEDIEDD